MNMPRATGRRGRGFTLLELMAVLAITAILFLLIVPAAWRSVEVGRAASCAGQLRGIAVGLNGYLNDHDLTMPTLKAGRSHVADAGPVIDTEFLPYLHDKKVFLCPSDTKIGRVSGTSYYWNTTLNGQRMSSLDFMKLTSDPSRIPVMADKEAFHPYLDNKVNMLYADGHATKDLKFVTDPPAK